MQISLNYDLNPHLVFTTLNFISIMLLLLTYFCMYRNVLWHTMFYFRRDKLLEGGPVAVRIYRDVMSTQIKWTFIAQTYHHWHLCLIYVEYLYYVSLCVISSCHASSKHSIYSDVIYSIRWLTVVYTEYNIHVTFNHYMRKTPTMCSFDHLIEQWLHVLSLKLESIINVSTPFLIQ